MTLSPETLARPVRDVPPVMAAADPVDMTDVLNVLRGQMLFWRKYAALGQYGAEPSHQRALAYAIAIRIIQERVA